MELHKLNLSPVVSRLSVESALFTPEGQGPCSALHSPSSQLGGLRVAGICHSTNTWLITWIPKGAGFFPWDPGFCYHEGTVCGTCIMDVWMFKCAKASPTIMYSLNYWACTRHWARPRDTTVPVFKELVVNWGDENPENSVTVKSCYQGRTDWLYKHTWTSQADESFDILQTDIPLMYVQHIISVDVEKRILQ